MIRRNTLNTLERLRAFDELDLWVYYLDTGLYEEETFSDPDAPDIIALASQTDDLDAYYLWKSGARSKKAKKPVQKMHNQFRRMLDHLDGERPEGFIEASVALLNMADRDRRLVSSKLKTLKKDSARRDRFRDMTLGYTGSLGSRDVRYGLTWMTGPQVGSMSWKGGSTCIAKRRSTNKVPTRGSASQLSTGSLALSSLTCSGRFPGRRMRRWSGLSQRWG